MNPGPILAILFMALSPQGGTVIDGVPENTMLQIVEAEDLRRWDESLGRLLGDPNDAVRRRAALAAGRIGKADAIAGLSQLLESDASESVAQMAAFALGEIESASAEDTLLNSLRTSKSAGVRARAIEALGKIAAVLPETQTDARRRIGDAILEALRQPRPDTQMTLLGLTSLFRARPDGGAAVAAHFLDSSNPQIRENALNALARLRAKESLDRLRAMVTNDIDPIVRANAARALAAVPDPEALDALSLAVADTDHRVRIGAIRALGAVGDNQAAPLLLKLGHDSRDPNDLLEIASALGTLLRASNDEAAVSFLLQLRGQGVNGPEMEIAYARISPGKYVNDPFVKGPIRVWQQASAVAQALGDLGASTTVSETIRANALLGVRSLLQRSGALTMALPDTLIALQAFKPADLGDVARGYLNHADVVVRATSADILSELPVSEENTRALIAALRGALTDKVNDATLSIVQALGKGESPEAKIALQLAGGSRDYLVRRRAEEILKTPNASVVVSTRNLRRDYDRAVGRIGKSVRARLSTDKGVITIELLPSDAPLTVDSFVTLARARYFDGLTFHRVVPNFVIQGGDPRGDGNGGPEYQIRCEINMVPYETGTVGMALSGKDTGGSQFFITHSPQPHLDGGYAVFGRVVEGMNVVNNIARGDRIRSVRIVESNSERQGR